MHTYPLKTKYVAGERFVLTNFLPISGACLIGHAKKCLAERRDGRLKIDAG